MISEQILHRAVVEDNNDPLKVGRVRVRIHAVHTENKSEIKAAELPWAEVIGSNDFGLVGGVGTSSVLRQGTWVWVILELGDVNKPIVVGTIKGVNSETSEGKSEGFYDPDGLYPFKDRSTESDINRLVRGEQLNSAYNQDGSPTIHQKINDTLDIQTGISDSVSGADVSQSEPSSTDDSTKYPNANVIETESGHVLQFDDTSGNERIRLYHKTGSYIEIKPDGSIVQKSVNEDNANHYIHMSDVNNHVKKSVKTYIEENLDEIIGGYVKRHVNGTLDEHITDAVKKQLDSTLNETVAGKVTMDHQNKVTWNVGTELEIVAGSKITMTVGGTSTVADSGSYKITSGRIDLN